MLDGAVTARGSVTLEPLDYSALLEQAQQIQADFAAPAATSATVDTEGAVEEQPAAAVPASTAHRDRPPTAILPTGLGLLAA